MKNLTTILLAFLPILSIQGQTNILPRPSGKYSLSIHYLHFTDAGRTELFDNDLNSKREITIKVWYPTDEKSTREPYLQNADFAIKYCQMPEVFRNLKTNSGRDLSVSSREKQYPILLFSHGWGEHFSQNSILMEELASHGYIVFSIAHHFECRFSSYPDGRMHHINMKSQRLQKIWGEMLNPKARELILHKLPEAKNDEERIQILREMENACPTGLIESPKYWAEDISFILDQLEIMNKENAIFKEKMNLDRIGVFGMSMGGIAANEISTSDKRVKAGVNIDGGMSNSLISGKLQIPFLFLNNERWQGYGKIFSDRSESDCYALWVKDSEHMNFADYSIYPAPYVKTLLGTIDGEKTIDIMNVMIRAFFDKYLKGNKNVDLIKLAEKYPEIESVKNFK